MTQPLQTASLQSQNGAPIMDPRALNWIATIALFTAVNVGLMAVNTSVYFPVGLVSSLAAYTLLSGIAPQAAAIIIALILAAGYGLLWYAASKGSKISYGIAVAAYVVDTLIAVGLMAFLEADLLVDLVIHGIGLFIMISALRPLFAKTSEPKQEVKLEA